MLRRATFNRNPPVAMAAVAGMAAQGGPMVIQEEELRQLVMQVRFKFRCMPWL